MTGNEAVGKIRQSMALMWEVIKDADIHEDVVMYNIVDPKILKNSKPFQSVDIGDYEFTFDEEHGFTACYRSKKGYEELYFDPSDRIDSLTLPPKKKSPEPTANEESKPFMEKGSSKTP